MWTDLILPGARHIPSLPITPLWGNQMSCPRYLPTVCATLGGARWTGETGRRRRGVAEYSVGMWVKAGSKKWTLSSAAGTMAGKLLKDTSALIPHCATMRIVSVKS